MKRSVENAEQVGMQLLTINLNDKALTLIDIRLITLTTSQYFRDEQRRRHSQYDRGWRRPCSGKQFDATASSFQPYGQRYKGKNALVFYPEGSPTVAGALSQDMDISQERQNLRTSQPSQYHSRLAFAVSFREDPMTLLPQYPLGRSSLLLSLKMSSQNGTSGDKSCFAKTHRTSESPFSTSSPTHWRAALKNHRGSEDSTTSLTLTSSSPNVTSELPSCFGTFPNKDGQPPSAQIVGVSLSGGPIVCFDSGWPELFGDFVVSRFDPRRKAVLISSFSSQFILTCHGKARRSMYGADMLPRTTDFGVTPEEARELHQKQQAYDAANVNAGKEAAAQDAAVRGDGGIWDGSAPKDDVPTGNDNAKLVKIYQACQNLPILDDQRLYEFHDSHDEERLNCKQHIYTWLTTSSIVDLGNYITEVAVVACFHTSDLLVLSQTLFAASSSFHRSRSEKLPQLLKEYQEACDDIKVIHTPRPIINILPFLLSSTSLPSITIYTHCATDRSIEAPRGLPSRQQISHSLIITDPTTISPVSGLTMGEQTVSRIFHCDLPTVTCRNCETRKDTSAGETREANISSALYPSLNYTQHLIVTTNCIALVIMVNKPYHLNAQRRSEHQLRSLSKSEPDRRGPQATVFLPISTLQPPSVHSLPPISRTLRAISHKSQLQITHLPPRPFSTLALSA
ncbi:hypothetical protein FAGAP_1039 [Fusarium agapanthi]|uniref:Uncharacterized protein n=1 Tax=Fusarium agapanthi TaxID=1803897 RepID=A0A9P5BI67_9HYPO|nr:hypothetical protein FAGAP_1039 [Fusarium agapanthi]